MEGERERGRGRVREGGEVREGGSKYYVREKGEGERKISLYKYKTSCTHLLSLGMRHVYAYSFSP